MNCSSFKRFIISCGVALSLATGASCLSDFYESGNEDTDSYEFYDADQILDAKVKKLVNEAQTCDMYAVQCMNSGDSGLAHAYTRLAKAARRLADALTQGYSDSIAEAKNAYNRARSLLNTAIAQRR